MTLSNTSLDRGMIGNLPALSFRADEAYTDFMCDTRNYLMHAQFKGVTALAEKHFAEADVSLEHTHEGVAKAREIIRQVPELATYFRVKRSCQEIYKQRIIESYGLRRDEFIRKLEDAEKRGPGTVTFNPSIEYPDYATVEIHIQPGGYCNDPLAGLIYDYGTSVFFGGANAGDALHRRHAGNTSPPKDGKVNRILDLACSIGQLSSELKKRFTGAEVIGIDISAPMVRYAHWRALQQNLDVHFAQMAAEDLRFPDNHFDMVTSYLLFHEIPQPVIRKVLSEIRRVLRPGGAFVMWDFISATKEVPGYGGLTGLMDAADNGEPYAYAFVKCGIEDLIEEAGLTMRSKEQAVITKLGRVADK